MTETLTGIAILREVNGHLPTYTSRGSYHESNRLDPTHDFFSSGLADFQSTLKRVYSGLAYRSMSLKAHEV
jgi:hypothetical protein